MASEAKAGHFFEDLLIGMEASLVRIVRGEDLTAFARITGDANPIHLDEDYAATTAFRRRIAHGMLSASYISAVLGTKLPGPGCIYVSQTLNFRAPVHIDDEVVSTVRITDLIEPRRRAIFFCACTVGAKVVADGEAVIMIPSRMSK